MKKNLAVLISLLLICHFGHAADQKEWTLLVFMNGHNNGLGTYGDLNIQAMEKVGSNNNVNIVVEQGADNSDGSANLGSQRIFVQNLVSQVVSSSDNTDMGSSIELYDFIQWAVHNYPAKHYMLDVWNHGIGWHSYTQSDDPNVQFTPGPDVDGSRDISVDGNSNHYITTEQLGHVLTKFAKLIGHKVDVYGSDACMEAMVEVAGEMKDSVQYFVGSQEEEPMMGWPYDTWLARWANLPNAAAEEVVRPLVEEYVKYYVANPDPSLGATFSAYNLDYLPAFEDAVSGLRNVLVGVTGAQKQSVDSAITTTDTYGYTDYKDFYGFFTAIQNSGAITDKSVLQNVDTAFKQFVVANANSGSHAASNGVSIWIPDPTNYSQFISRYKGLKFDQQTKWSDFLATVSTK